MVMVTLVVLLLVVMPGFLYLVGWAVNKYTGTKLDRSPVATTGSESKFLAAVDTGIASYRTGPTHDLDTVEADLRGIIEPAP